MPKIARFFIAAFILLVLAKPTYAVTTALSEVPTEISEESFTIKVQIVGASANTNNYLRIDLFVPSTTNYFGYTNNGQDFYNGSTYSLYPKVVIGADGTSTTTIEGQLDLTSSTFKGKGDYQLRVRRYTSSGNYSSTEANAGAISVKVNASLPSPSPTPSQSTSSPSPTLISTTASPSTTPRVTSTYRSPSPKASSSNFPEVLSSSSESALVSPNIAPSPSSLVASEKESKPIPLIAFILIISGGVLFCLAMGAYVWYKKQMAKQNSEK